jgi:hypothetical protein
MQNALATENETSRYHYHQQILFHACHQFFIAESWHENIVELCADHQRLRTISNLDKLINLRKASFCDNEITDIAGFCHSY